MISRDNKEKRRSAVNLAAECGKVTCSNTFRICKLVEEEEESRETIAGVSF